MEPSWQFKSGSALEALAAGFRDAGVQFVTNYPGFHSNELTDRLGCVITSINERTAMAIAWGAAAGGMRTVTAFKNVGLNDAADPYLNAQVLAIHAGLVVVVFDDIDDEHSQIRQDSRHYFDFHGGLWFEPMNKQDAYDTALRSFDLSETMQCPVTVRVTNLLCKDTLKSGCYKRIRRDSLPPRPVRTHPIPGEMVVHPITIPAQRDRLATRQLKITELVHLIHPTPQPQTSNSLALTVGHYHDNALPPNSDQYHLRTYPIPERHVEALLAQYREVTVHEHGDPFVYNKVRSLPLGNQLLRYQPMAARKPNRSYHCRSDFEKLFAILRGYPDSVIVGDLGEYTMDPLQSISHCLCYGSAVAVSAGISASRPDRGPIFAVVGDGAFLHWGKSVLAEVLERRLKVTIIVFVNGGCRGTGGQKIPGDLYDIPDTCRVRHVDFTKISMQELQIMVYEAAEHRDLSILFLHQAECN